MSGSILVAYGSKYGSTAEIAETIGEVLRKHGHSVEVRTAGDVRDVSSFDAVVLGGALYAGRWHRGARRFARRHRKALAVRPLWLFSSGPLDTSATEREVPVAPGVQRVTRKLDAREHVTFGGRLDENADGRMARMIVKSGKGGDFRDFGVISAWAEKIARDPVLGSRP
ncbi:flavodoxin domain-containing protein [Streptomyces mesophilus]|uniref:flavodoxin domain-containing protein n=1 Tax=Streptomyces mesophilus TaxID=1775132 RepID=UPI00332F1219